jgi:trehalose/maltose hydrolase-like predicted phosphorylase
MVFTYGFLGIFHGKDALHTAPRLPDEIQGVYYETTYRGERVGMLYDGENEVEIFIENPSREAMLRGIPVNASGMKMLLNEENGYYFSSREEKMKQQPQAA